jgi:hypothetical protein
VSGRPSLGDQRGQRRHRGHAGTGGEEGGEESIAAATMIGGRGGFDVSVGRGCCGCLCHAWGGRRMDRGTGCCGPCVDTGVGVDTGVDTGVGGGEGGGGGGGVGGGCNVRAIFGLIAPGTIFGDACVVFMCVSYCRYGDRWDDECFVMMTWCSWCCCWCWC